MEGEGGEVPAYEYTTFPRQFASYRWFKPLLVALLAFVLMVLFQIVVLLVAIAWSGDANFVDVIGNGYDDMDVFTGPGAFAELGGIATILPALALAALAVRDRPFSSYSSSRGGWNWDAFAKCLIVAAVVMGAVMAVEMALSPDDGGDDGAILFTVEGVITCVALAPLQCLAEEYLFRGLVMQTVGSWTRLPAVAVIVQAAVFAAGHPYNAVGVAAIFVDGVIWGFVTWRTKGLEAASALHVANNVTAFFLEGVGLSTSTSEVDLASLAIDAAMVATYAVIVILVGKRYDWFAPTGDGTRAFNERLAGRRRPETARPPRPPMLEDAPYVQSERTRPEEERLSRPPLPTTR